MDRTVARGGLSRRLWLALAALVVLVVAGAFAWPAYRQLASVDRAMDASRMQLAPVTLGNLVRDASADGRIVSANAPTLFAATGGIVTLKVKAGDPVTRGQLLADNRESGASQQAHAGAERLESLEVALGRARIKPGRATRATPVRSNSRKCRRREPSATSNARGRPTNRAC